MFIKKTIAGFFAILFVLICGSENVFATTFSFPFNRSIFSMGETFYLPIAVNTEGLEVNAMSVDVKYPDDLLEVAGYSSGDSIINFWTQKPVWNNGIVSFEGIIPGGYEENFGFVLKIAFKAKKEGIGTISIINSSRVLLNDGLGSNLRWSSKNFNFEISENLAQFGENKTITDKIPPENFSLQLSKDPGIFEGKLFLVFSALDKESGIDHYEAAEEKSIWSRKDFSGLNWEKVDSPYLLKDQNLKSYVYVKAVDFAGNERISEMKPISGFSQYFKYLFLIIMLLTAVAFILFELWKSSKK